MKNYTFKVENDKGILVNKTESASWIKNHIIQDLERVGLRTTFRVRQTSDNSVEAYDTKGNTITYHYGGFDDCEVLEPYNHGNWTKKPRKLSAFDKFLQKHNVTMIEQIKLIMTKEKIMSNLHSGNLTLDMINRVIKRNRNNPEVRDFYKALRTEYKHLALAA